MTQLLITLSEYENRILDIVKGKFGVKNKSQAINIVIDKFGEELLEPELRPEFLGRLEKIRKGKYLSRKEFEKEVGKVFRYCLSNNSFISQLRIRSSTHIGKHTGTESLFLSEIVNIVSKIVGINSNILVSHSLEKGTYYSNYLTQHHMPCHLEIEFYSLCDDVLNMRKDNKPIINKIMTIFSLLFKVGFKNFFIIMKKLSRKSEFSKFTIMIRSWPDKYRIDLGEIQRCPSAYVSCLDYKILPFCYALILNEKNHIL